MRKVGFLFFFFEGIKSSEGRKSASVFSSHAVYSNWKLASLPLSDIQQSEGQVSRPRAAGQQRVEPRSTTRSTKCSG